MRVFITGIRGFLGSALAGALKARGHEVRGSASVPGELPCIRLGEPFDPAVFDGVDTIVHAAHDFRPGTTEINIAGARALFDATPERHRILLSSHSARADAKSEYGISKYKIERFFLENETVVRPGLVLGAGGAFGRRVAAIRKCRVVPLVDGGRDPVAVLALADFCTAMVRIVEGRLRGNWNLFSRDEPTIRDIIDVVLRTEGRRAWKLSVPYSFAVAAVRIGEPWLSIDAGSLRALRLNRHRVHESNLHELVAVETNWKKAIASALSARQ